LPSDELTDRLDRHFGVDSQAHTVLDRLEEVRLSKVELVDVARTLAEVWLPAKDRVLEFHIKFRNDGHEELGRLDVDEHVKVAPGVTQVLMLKTPLDAQTGRLDLDLLTKDYDIVSTIL